MPLLWVLTLEKGIFLASRPQFLIWVNELISSGSLEHLGCGNICSKTVGIITDWDTSDERVEANFKKLVKDSIMYFMVRDCSWMPRYKQLQPADIFG